MDRLDYEAREASGRRHFRLRWYDLLTIIVVLTVVTIILLQSLERGGKSGL